MAQRPAGKTKRRAAGGDARTVRKPGAAAGRDGGGGTAPDTALRERIRLLEAQLSKAESELAAALARNKVLEDNHDQVRNRIDWVIDSLHNLMEK
jgi:hypothetical protein